METSEYELIKKLAATNFEVKRLFRQHQEYERVLKDYEAKKFLTSQEQRELRQLKLAKLHGKERLLQLVHNEEEHARTQIGGISAPVLHAKESGT